MELGLKKIGLDKLGLDQLRSKLKLDQNTTVVISIVMFVVAFFIWKQFIFRVEKLESDKLNQEIKKTEFRNEVGRLDEVLATYESKIPRISDVSWLLDRVVGIADKAHIRLTFFEPMSSETYDKYTKVAVRIRVFATYHELGILIGMIESTNRFIRIDGIKVKNDIKTNVAEAELVISALVIKEGR
ncbi:MAG: hypothetical protein FJZ16_06515 [Candidatus Omnitrophica bacterium]|nr:hypothetical protein [Candidatus Omnitrophota bacterium]